MKNLFKRLANNADPKSLSYKLRLKRYNFFLNVVNLAPEEVILDVGCGWGGSLEQFNQGRNRVVGLDIVKPEKNSELFDDFIVGDCRDMSFFSDTQFDVVFSNSLIEHLPTKADQAKCARELIRVGKKLFLQTPNKYFLIEPHYLFPFFQFFSERLQRWLTKHFSLGWYAKGNYEKIRLLSKSELKELFPGCDIYHERFLFLTKSFYVVRVPERMVQREFT